jgi:hypothetical protein
MMALDRPQDQAQPGGGMKAKFGSAAYAMEELHAEHSTLLTAALLSAIVPTLFPRIATDHDRRTRDGNLFTG